VKPFSQTCRDLALVAVAAFGCWSLWTLTGSARDVLGSVNRLAWYASVAMERAEPDLLATAAEIRALVEGSVPIQRDAAGIAADARVVADRLAAPPDAKTRKLSPADRFIRLVF
jgi:hypothetical protein